MSRKNSKTSFRSFFQRKSSVMPLEDEEAGPSHDSDISPASIELSPAANDRENPDHNVGTFIVTNERNQSSMSKTSLPSFPQKPKHKNTAMISIGSPTVRSIVTPPRGHSITKVEEHFQQKPEGTNNNDNNNDRLPNNDTTCTCSSRCSLPSTKEEAQAKVTASKESSNESYCRICHDNPSKFELVAPCLCKGTMGLVHLYCLERWLGESGKNICEICGFEYVTKRKPKYTGCRSIFNWLRHPLSAADTRNVVFDLACFCILTPLAAVSAWLCVLGAQHYTFDQEPRRLQNKAEEKGRHHGGRNNRGEGESESAANSTWTSVGLLTLTGTLLSAYIVWLVVAFRFHLQVYRDWQNKNFIVTIVPMTSADHAAANEMRNTETATIRSVVIQHFCERRRQNNLPVFNNNDEMGWSDISSSTDDNVLDSVMTSGSSTSAVDPETVASLSHIAIPTFPIESQATTTTENGSGPSTPPLRVNSAPN